MNPIFTWIISHTVAKALARRCPKCGRETIVAKEKANATVSCPRCGASIPPKPTR